MKNIALSVKRSILPVIAVGAGIALCAGTAYAVPVANSINVPVYGSCSDITENTVILTGDATVTSQLSVTAGAGLNVSIKLNKVSGRSAMSGVALEAAGSFSGLLPVANQGTVTFPVTVYPAGSDATDPEAFTVNASVKLNLTPAGAPAGGLGQFTVVLSPVA